MAVFAAVWKSGLTEHLSWAGLARNQTFLKSEVAAHPVLAPFLYLCIYFGAVTLSLPQAAVLTISGGLLFGTVAGGALAVIGATTGAVALFLIARSAFGATMVRRAGPRLDQLCQALVKDGFSYLLAIRLIPVVPFWLVNLAAPLCGMRLHHFAAATFLGIAPATFILASIGSGLGEVLAKGEQPDLSVILSFPILGPLLALAALSVTPVLWRKFRASHG